MDGIATFRRPSRLFDRAGTLWAILCGLHCLALPLAFVVMPALAASLYSFHAAHHSLAIALLRVMAWEPWFVAASAVISGVAMGHGLYWHRQGWPASLAVAGVACLLAGWFGQAGFDGWMHIIGIGCGGCLLVTAHFLNLRLLAGTCRH